MKKFQAYLDRKEEEKKKAERRRQEETEITRRREEERREEADQGAFSKTSPLKAGLHRNPGMSIRAGVVAEEASERKQEKHQHLKLQKHQQEKNQHLKQHQHN
jgi:hypothetical protein